MSGLAKKMFLESSVGQLKAFVMAQVKKSPWPLLENALHERCLSYADFELSKRLLRSLPQVDESAAVLLCHLSAAARKGHLCVRIDDDSVYPAVEDIWNAADEEDVNVSERDRLWLAIAEKVRHGRKAIAPLLYDATENAAERCFAAIYRYGNLFYLQRYWKLESAFIEHLSPLIAGCRPTIEIGEADVKMRVDNLLSSGRVLKEQAQAIMQGCLHPFTVIVGGPGTGKTHTAGLLIKVLWDSMSEDQRSLCKFALAAPTGKAAANLEESIQRAMRSVEGFPKLAGQTLHSLLGAGRMNRDDFISADVLLVDECSMIDAQMMALLLGSLKPGARLIMLGDKHQLPPVEAGALFAALVDVLQASSEYSPNVIALETCLRAELESIIALAKNVNDGNLAKALEILKSADGTQGLRLVSWQGRINMKDLQHQLLTYCVPKFPVMEVVPENPLDILQEFTRFRMLTPLRKGLLGVEALNQLFFESALGSAKHAACFAAPIMIQSNDYRTGLFNGEVGLLIKQRQANGSFSYRHEKNDYAVFASKSDRDGQENARRIPALLLPKFDYAYCLSIHKSQGSEFEHVLLLLPEGCEQFGREALYTGVTRARQKLEVWGSIETIQRMVERHAQRCSGVDVRFQSRISTKRR